MAFAVMLVTLGNWVRRLMWAKKGRVQRQALQAAASDSEN